MSHPGLQRAIEKLKQKGLYLDDVPSDPDSQDWNAWKDELGLEHLDFLA
jgi:hypothetical protein